MQKNTDIHARGGPWMSEEFLPQELLMEGEIEA